MHCKLWLSLAEKETVKNRSKKSSKKTNPSSSSSNSSSKLPPVCYEIITLKTKKKKKMAADIFPRKKPASSSSSTVQQHHQQNLSNNNLIPAPNWQGLYPTIRERNAVMFNNDLMADVHFVVGPPGGTQRLPGHKYVLAVGSSVFHAMFYGELAEDKDEIRIPDVDPAAFLAMLNPHKAARIRRIAGAVYCRAMLDQHCVITWASGGQARFTPASWVKRQDYWEGRCQEGREDCSLAHSRERAAKR